MATSQDFVTWSCRHALDPDFLMNALLAEGAGIRRFGEGSTHTTIYFPEVKAFHVALPPVPEQRRIVAKIDSLIGKSKPAITSTTSRALSRNISRPCWRRRSGAI
jgi:type I restriction enzyme S subunit